MSDPVVIDFKKLQVYEAGALLLTHFAHPEKDISDDQRGNIHASLCAIAMRNLYNDGNVTDYITPQSIKPIYFRDESQIKKALKTFRRRMRDRATAGRMAMAFLQEAETAITPDLPEPASRLSLNEVAKVVLRDVGQSDPENVETRVWRPSIPVIHLAAAAQFIMQKAKRETGVEIDYRDVLVHDFLIESIVSVAEYYESLIAKSTKLDIQPDELIRFRVVH